jgi:flagellar motility protein MotE (MotC chaperone)
MSNYQYSLCLSYPRLGYTDRYAYFRIADFDVRNGKFIQAECSSLNDDFSSAPKQISCNPVDMVPFSTSIRKWNFDEENQKIYSFNYDLKDENEIYEVIFPKELQNIEYDHKKIRDVLKSGITINPNSCENLLIVISTSGTHHAVIYCKKSLFKQMNGLFYLQQNISDMHHVIHSVNAYDISSYSIITTTDLKIKLNDGEYIERYFYNSTMLPEECDTFNLYNIEEYVPQFVASYLKKEKIRLQISNTNIKNIVSAINSALQEESVINEYFSMTGYSQEDILSVLPLYSDVISSAILSDDKVDEIVSNCLMNSDDSYKKCIEIGKEEWLAEKSEEQKNIKNEISNTSKELEHLQKEKSKLLQEIENVKKSYNRSENEKNKLLLEIESKKQSLVELNQEIQDELNEFSNNIVKQVELISIANCQNRADTGVSVSSNCKAFSQVREEVVEDKDDFEELLQENFEIVGYNGDFALQMAQIVAFCIGNSLPVIVSRNSVQIANAIAATFSKRSITYINVPVGYTNYDLLAQQINSKNGVVHISGLFDGFNESAFIYINNLIENKIPIILSADGIDIQMMPNNILDSAMYIDGGIGFGLPKSDLFVSAENDIDFVFDYQKDAINEQKKWLKPFIKAGVISNIAALNYSKFMAYIDFDESNDWILWLQICANCKPNNFDDMLERLDSSNLKENKKFLMECILKG